MLRGKSWIALVTGLLLLLATVVIWAFCHRRIEVTHRECHRTIGDGSPKLTGYAQNDRLQTECFLEGLT